MQYLFRFGLPILAAALFVNLLGCVHHCFEAREPFQISKEEISSFAYSAKPEPPRFVFDEECANYVVYKVQIKVKDFEDLKNPYIQFWYFLPKSRGKKLPVAMVLPPTGGDYEAMKGFGRYFADRGFVSLVFERREPYFDPRRHLQYNKYLIRQSAIDVRRTIDFLCTQPDIDTEKIGLAGVSLGAVICVLATASDDRIKSLCLIIGSGDLPQIMSTTGYSRVKKFRDVMLQNKGLTLKELPTKGADLLAEIDPLTYSSHLDPEKILMINGRFDNIVKYRVAKKTWESLRKPEWYVIPTTHYGTIAFQGFVKEKIYSRFLKDFGLEPSS